MKARAFWDDLVTATSYQAILFAEEAEEDEGCVLMLIDLVPFLEGLVGVEALCKGTKMRTKMNQTTTKATLGATGGGGGGGFVAVSGAMVLLL